MIPATPPGPAALTLVAATYEEATWVRLTFDRAVNVAALDGSQIVLDDGPISANLFNATGP